MAIIKCPECGSEVADAAACPECGKMPEAIAAGGHGGSSVQPGKDPVGHSDATPHPSEVDNGGVGVRLGCLTVLLFIPVALGLMALIVGITPATWFAFTPAGAFESGSDSTPLGHLMIWLITPVSLFTLLWVRFNKKFGPRASSEEDECRGEQEEGRGEETREGGRYFGFEVGRRDRMA